MKILDVLQAIGCLVGLTADKAAFRLDEEFGCPPTDEYCSDYSCRDCWRKWLEEEVKLQ